MCPSRSVSTSPSSTVRTPDGNGDFLDNLNPESLKTVNAFGEPLLADAKVGDVFQFERMGYYCVDPDTTPSTPVFNQTVSLRDSWKKKTPQPEKKELTTEDTENTEEVASLQRLKREEAEGEPRRADFHRSALYQAKGGLESPVPPLILDPAIRRISSNPPILSDLCESPPLSATLLPFEHFDAFCGSPPSSFFLFPSSFRPRSSSLWRASAFKNGAQSAFP